MYPTRLNLHNSHLPPTKKEIVHDKLRVGYGEPKIYGQSKINMWFLFQLREIAFIEKSFNF